MDKYRMLFIWFFSISYMRTSSSQDSLALSQSIHDGETLVSANGTFEVGFFSPGSSTTRYLGVWYRNVTPLTVVWVANRETPLQNNSGVLEVNEKGVLLLLLNDTNSIVWSSSSSISLSSTTVNDPIAQLLDSGNLVVKTGRDASENDFLWQSFDHPCDILLPGMKIGWNLVTRQEIFLSSWKSADDPAKGEYHTKYDLRGYPQYFILKGSDIISRPGSWNGQALTAYPTHQPTQNNIYEFVFNEKEVYYGFKAVDRSIFFILRLSPSGVGQRILWTSQQNSGQDIINTDDACENYALCGRYSICNLDGNSPSCECLKGFVPMFPEQWSRSYWNNGCVRNIALDCNDKDGFSRYTSMKLPDTSSSWYSKTMSLEECQKTCLKNCSCTAYTNLDIRSGGSGCLLWFDNLIDMRKFSQGGQDLYIRVPASELEWGKAMTTTMVSSSKHFGIAASKAMLRWKSQF